MLAENPTRFSLSPTVQELTEAGREAVRITLYPPVIRQVQLDNVHILAKVRGVQDK